MRRSRTKPVVIMILAGVMAVAVLVVSLRTVSAQTPTPTPWPTWVPTPDPSDDTIIWACRLMGTGSAPICTWGDYFEVSGLIDSYDEGPQFPSTGGYDTVILSPPAATRAITATCTYHIIASAYVPSPLSGSTESVVNIDEALYVDVTVDGVPGHYDDGQEVYSGQSYDVMETVDVVWRLPEPFVNWGSPDPFTSDYSDRQLFARFSGRAVYLIPNWQGAEGYAGYRIACQIDQVERINGEVYEPGNPTAGDWQDIDWDESIWSDWSWYDEDPVTGEFDISNPITGSCFTIIPQVSVTVPVPSILSYVAEDIPIGWDGHQVCIIERSLTLDWMDLDLAQMAYTWIMVSVVWWMIGVVRRS